ncbi:MAG TPA: acyl-CoA dehydratase activase [Gemmatimonadaceae bacterium]|nr:acyl-CoA dehydratase activase [Gemmatimonadaceae bacterium]
MGDEIYLGLDIGSTTVKVVALDAQRRLLAHSYRRASGRPRQTLLEAAEILAPLGDRPIAGVGLTGSGGGPIARIIGGHHVNELIAQTRAVGEYHREARTVIEIGGQDSKFLSVQWDARLGQMIMLDFAMNALCAAGTGSFLDQQAERLGIAIDREFAETALRSTSPARIAGRCTVFAKSDMIHLQQKGTPLADILMGLSLALARNFRSVIGKGKAFAPPIIFQGGVAYNAAVARAFEMVLELEPRELIVPEHHHIMAAIGTALNVMDEEAAGAAAPFLGFDALAEAVRSGQREGRTLPQLPVWCRSADATLSPLPDAGPPPPVWLGVDVGSISTKAALIDAEDRVVARHYRMTAGRPLEAIREALAAIGADVGSRVAVVGAGATGSGRYLTGDFIGADVVRNEITSQARAAVALDPTVDTILEIGGQDSKFIRIDNGAVVDFTMNNACAAGTGAFLEEQAERLRIDLARDFSRLAFASPCPAALGERCTVFMESDIVHHQQQGARLEDLTGGLAYSIAENYLNRVVNGRPIGRNVFFQGAVAFNRSVVAAFEARTRRRITVPPHNDVTGAIGAAILAREAMARRGAGATTRFRGFDLADRRYESTVFECRACPNLCEVSRVVLDDEPPIFYGARCDRFEEAGRGHDATWRAIPDLFAERSALLLGGWTEPGARAGGRLRVAMPRTLLFNEHFPFWRAFFAALGMDVVLSRETNPEIVKAMQEHAVIETCVPAKLVFGHVRELLDADADVLFLPSVLTAEDIAPGQIHAQICPIIAASSQLVTAHLHAAAQGRRVLALPLHLWPARLRRQELDAFAPALGVAVRRVRTAAAAADAAQREFRAALRRAGDAALSLPRDGLPGIVIVGRPYNTCDLGACQDLPLKLRRMGVLPIPMDYLPLDTVDISTRYADMYWRSGQRILAAATLVAADPRLHAIYLTNFDCGPDSFLLTYFRRMMGGKPFLELEMDDHTADAGVITRCEAFLDSLDLRATA